MAEKLQKVGEQTSKKRHLKSQIFVILAALGFGILTLLAKTNPYFPIDLVITRFVQAINILGFDFLMRFLTFLGNFPAHHILPTLVVIYLVLLKLRKEALMILVSIGGAYLISEIVKRIVARPRPDGSLIIQIGEYLKHDSFPSGHVLFYIGFFGFLAYAVYTILRHGLFRQILMIIFPAMILLIGVSRIYLGAHWFSDVLGSYLIGSVWLYLVIWLYHKFS